LSTTGVDWQRRFDYDIINRERLRLATDVMEAADLSALVLFAGAIACNVTDAYLDWWSFSEAEFLCDNLRLKFSSLEKHIDLPKEM